MGGGDGGYRNNDVIRVPLQIRMRIRYGRIPRMARAGTGGNVAIGTALWMMLYIRATRGTVRLLHTTTAIRPEIIGERDADADADAEAQAPAPGICELYRWRGCRETHAQGASLLLRSNASSRRVTQAVHGLAAGGRSGVWLALWASSNPSAEGGSNGSTGGMRTGMNAAHAGGLIPGAIDGERAVGLLDRAGTLDADARQVVGIRYRGHAWRVACDGPGKQYRAA
ncbi:hypothetical protein BD310DRAFT_241339 [Dichomitus squalens]|uniref:Uncharacterized protein n=1 Tax=Dichomitus squalens TaxID=114155 RepID=A0A4Q9PC50_9APHY|nr:hypothetical protein BD310DRAFT_241339 [Dichomitus squalens]